MDITSEEYEQLKKDLGALKMRLARTYIDLLIKEAEIYQGKRQIQKLQTLKTFLME